MHSTKVIKNIERHNELRDMDHKIYNLIDLCQKSKKIEWKKIYKDNEEFRNTQKKKIEKDKPPTDVNDLVELVTALKESEKFKIQQAHI